MYARHYNPLLIWNHSWQNAYLARISAVRRRERTRRLQQETINLNLKIEKAAFDLELAEVERQNDEQKVEEIKQKYIEYKMKKWMK